MAGLGPETVDAILLYAAHRPVFVADAYTRRVLGGHRLLSPDARYEEARQFIEAHLPSDPALFNEFHALLVAAGKASRARLIAERSPGGSSRAARRHQGRRASGPARPSP